VTIPLPSKKVVHKEISLTEVKQPEFINLTLAEPQMNEINLTLSSPTVDVVQIKKKVDPIENRIYRTYEVGGFKSIEGGTKNTLELTNCDVPVSQIKIRIEKNGSQIVFQRTIMENSATKDQIQRFSIPYMVTPDRITVTYDRHVEGGKLKMLMIKPQATAVVNSSGKSSFGQFCTIEIPAKGVSAGRVSMASGQTSDAFVFSPSGESKYPTEIVGELVDGSEGEVVIKFHCTSTEEQTKKKATQAITLPLKVSLENIDVTGHKVTVYKKKTVEGVTLVANATPQLDVVSLQLDCDIVVNEI